MNEALEELASADGQGDDDREEFAFKSWPFFWLTRATGRYLQKMEHELGPLGLDVPSWRVLMTLHEEKCLTVSEIADYAITKLPTMTRIVQRMQNEGLVECRVGASDRRVTEVLLTDKGEEAGQRAWEAANAVFSRAFKGISKRNRETLTKLLTEITDNLR